jgi:hypothetical protein
MTKASLAVAILLALTIPASAQSSANEMLSGCKGLIGDKTPPLREALRQGRCAGYVAWPCICEIGLFVRAGRGYAGAGGTRRRQVYRGATREDARAFW